MRGLALIAAAGLLVGAQGEDDGWPVVQRTKTTRATYTAYEWNVVRDDEGNPQDGWAAEFHSGDLHRLEIAGARIVANCRTHEGHIYDVKAGETQDSDTIWLTACGIDTTDQIVAVDRLAPIADKSGPLDVIRIKGGAWVRFYAIDRNGVIVRSNRIAANGSPSPCVQNRAVAILPTLPARDLFTRASLAKSFVPERYRQPPATPPLPGLGGAHCG